MFTDGSFGPSYTFDEFITQAQVFQYELHRAQFDALNVNRYKNTSRFINWMLNNAWPIMFWNQSDYSLNPNGTAYGARKGNEPVHILYNVYQKCVNSVMINIVLPNQTKGRYVKITPTGLMLESPAVGMTGR